MLLIGWEVFLQDAAFKYFTNNKDLTIKKHGILNLWSALFGKQKNLPLGLEACVAVFRDG